MPSLSKYAKFLTALTGLAGLAISQGLVAGATAKWLDVIIGAATALGVYLVPNTTPAPAAAPKPEQVPAAKPTP